VKESQEEAHEKVLEDREKVLTENHVLQIDITYFCFLFCEIVLDVGIYSMVLHLTAIFGELSKTKRVCSSL
jgi:hypothetical protein